jgi:hypothetical protein
MQPPIIGILRPGVRVLLRTEVHEDGAGLYCLIHTLSGEISLPPKAFVKAVREEVRKLERIARNSGCAEMRIEGRDWKKLLPDYLPWPEGEGHAIRKALI